MRAAILLVTLMGAPVRAAPPPFADFSHHARVSGVGAAGLYRLAIDEPVWRCSRAARLLGDVRIAGPDDEELPWMARPVPVELPPVPRPARVEVRSDGEGTTLVIDRGASPPADARLRLVAGAGDFVRPLSVDASDDGVRWRRIASGGIVYQLGASPPPNAHLEVEHPPDRSRFWRVTVGPGSTPAPLVGVEMLPRPTVEPRPAVVELEASRAQSDPVTRTTRVWLEQKSTPDDPPLPVAAITVTVPAPELLRRVVVSAEEGHGWRAVGSGVLYRPRAETVLGGVQENLRLAIDPVRARRLLLELQDGQAEPLSVTGALGEWGAHEVVFRADRVGPHTLYVGSAAVPPPSTTLASVEGRLAEARLGMLEPNPRFGVVAHEAPTREPRRWGWLLCGVAALVLAIGWSARRRLRAAWSGRARWV